MNLQKLCFILLVTAFSVPMGTAGSCDKMDDDEVVLMQRSLAIDRNHKNARNAGQEYPPAYTHSPSASQPSPRIQSNHSMTPRQQSPTQILLTEIEFEMWSDRTGTSTKSKVVLALLEGFGVPALFGVDRCYMGQVCVGVIKGLTVGGFGIWCFIDYIVVLINMLGEKENINSFGFSASFGSDDVKTAMWISIVFLAVHILSSLCCRSRKGKGNA